MLLNVTLNCQVKKTQVLNPQICKKRLKGNKSLNVFAFVFIFVIVFLLVGSCVLITLIKCRKGHKSLGSLFEGVF